MAHLHGTPPWLTSMAHLHAFLHTKRKGSCPWSCKHSQKPLKLTNTKRLTSMARLHAFLHAKQKGSCPWSSNYSQTTRNSCYIRNLHFRWNCWCCISVNMHDTNTHRLSWNSPQSFEQNAHHTNTITESLSVNLHFRYFLWKSRISQKVFFE